MRRLINLIGSRRFAVFLLVVTTVVILLSNLLPKVSIMDAKDVERLKREKPLLYGLSMRLGITGLAKSPYFQVIPAFVFLSIGICTIKRLKAALEIESREDVIPEVLPVKIIVPASHMDSTSIASTLKKRRWTVLEKDGTVYAVKGRRGVWGSLAFHLGMEIALVGILISVMMAVEGNVYLTEEFPVSVPRDIKGMGKDAVPYFPLRQIVLEKFIPVYAGGEFPIEYTCKLLVVGSDGRARRYEIGVNRPLTLDSFKLIFGSASFAPRFVLSRKNGDVIMDAVVNLDISMPGSTDSFDMPEEGVRVKTELFPDFYLEGGKPATRGKYPNNPALFVEIEKDGKFLGRGFLPMNKKVGFDEYSLEFKELKYWVKIIISRDAGVDIILAGFLVISLGLAVRFVLNDKHLWIIINPPTEGVALGLGGRAKYFPAMFDEELKALAEELASGDKKL